MTYLSEKHLEKLHLWEQSLFTDPKNFNTRVIQKTKNNGRLELKYDNEFIFTTHGISGGHFYSESNLTPLLKDNPESVFRKWDAISVCVVSDKAPYFYGSSIGFILGIPKQNILLTSPEDLWFNNHIGTVFDRNIDPSIKEKKVKNKKIINNGLLSFHVKEKFENLLPPLELFTAPKKLITDRDIHNEIIVCGKPNVNIHRGFPRTGEIKVKAAYVLINEEINQKKEEIILKKEFSYISKISQRFNIPLIFIPGLIK